MRILATSSTMAIFSVGPALCIGVELSASGGAEIQVMKCRVEKSVQPDIRHATYAYHIVDIARTGLAQVTKGWECTTRSLPAGNGFVLEYHPRPGPSMAHATYLHDTKMILKLVHAYLASVLRDANVGEVDPLYPKPNSLAYRGSFWRRGMNRSDVPIIHSSRRMPFNATNVKNLDTRKSKIARFVGEDFLPTLKDITSGPRLGKGGFGTVYRVTVKASLVRMFKTLSNKVPDAPKLREGQVVALKVQKIPGGDSRRQHSGVSRAMNEVKFQVDMATTGYAPHVFGSGVWKRDSETVHLTAMELIEGQTLVDYFDTHATISPQIFTKIECAAVTMLMRGYAHTDLNLQNIILLPNGKIKIIDYGLATRLPNRLIPRSRNEALSQDYHTRLLQHLNIMHAGTKHFAPEPHILRWLYAHVDSKQRKSNVLKARNQDG